MWYFCVNDDSNNIVLLIIIVVILVVCIFVYLMIQPGVTAEACASVDEANRVNRRVYGSCPNSVGRSSWMRTSCIQK